MLIKILTKSCTIGMYMYRKVQKVHKWSSRYPQLLNQSLPNFLHADHDAVNARI